MINKVKSVIILCFGDKALSKVVKEKIVVSMWIKLESLYMTSFFGTQTQFETTTIFVQDADHNHFTSKLKEF